MKRGAISFITGTGRCGTVTIASILALADNCLSMHEAVIKGSWERRTPPLPPFIRKNLEAYLNPSCADELLANLRLRQFDEIFKKYPEITHLSETAYYYAPFIKALNNIFPESRLAIIVRDGRYFVWSAYSADIPDRMPIGYVDERELNNHEKAVAAGRLRPKENTSDYKSWESFTPFQKNCWLWTETNRIILDGINVWNPGKVRIFKFEDIFNKNSNIMSLLDFLCIKGIKQKEINKVLSKKMNAREKRAIPHPKDWNPLMLAQFNKIAGSVMKVLGYY